MLPCRERMRCMRKTRGSMDHSMSRMPPRGPWPACSLFFFLSSWRAALKVAWQVYNVIILAFFFFFISIHSNYQSSAGLMCRRPLSSTRLKPPPLSRPKKCLTSSSLCLLRAENCKNYLVASVSSGMIRVLIMEEWSRVQRRFSFGGLLLTFLQPYLPPEARKYWPPGSWMDLNSGVILRARVSPAPAKLSLQVRVIASNI